MDKTTALKFLKENPVFWSRLGFSYQPPRYHEDGSLIVFNPTYSEAETHADFTAAGVKIHTCILTLGWVGVDKYDYSVCDTVLEKIFNEGKADYFIPRIKLDAPIEWCKENPEEITVYHHGPRQRDEIRELVGTLKQDYLGYPAPNGYFNANGWKDNRPNVGGLISLQSFSSKKWLEDASKALIRLIDHLENSPYGDRILAYHIAYGACGESMMWGRDSVDMWGDYGISHQKHFLDYAIEKYGSKDAVLKAWNITTLDGDIVPLPVEREKPIHNANDFYRNEETERRSIDYDEFMCKINVEALETFGKVVKAHTNDKIVGAFYGYIIHMSRTAYSGHLGWKRILNSPYIDFFAAPKSYHRSNAGEPGGEMAPTVSINGKKLWLDECDNRTHLSNELHFATKNIEETRAVLLRETCKNISHNSGLWYMDLGGNWYKDKAIMEHISKLTDLSFKLRNKPYKSTAKVVVIMDEESIIHAHPAIVRPGEDLLRNLQLAGTNVDIIFSYDIENIDLKDIRLAVMLHSCRLDDDYFAKLRKACPNAKILMVGKTKSALCQNLLPLDDTSKPEYRIKENEGLTPIFSDEYGITVAKTENGDFVSGTYLLKTEELRKILEKSSVECQAPINCTVYADSRVISFFPATDMEFIPNIDKGLKLTNLFTGERLDTTKPLNLKAKDGIAFMVE